MEWLCQSTGISSSCPIHFSLSLLTPVDHLEFSEKRRKMNFLSSLKELIPLFNGKSRFGFCFQVEQGTLDRKTNWFRRPLNSMNSSNLFKLVRICNSLLLCYQSLLKCVLQHLTYRRTLNTILKISLASIYPVKVC